jgi:3-isopropylmalate/(R)-2-methylmalate dehydratase large subunit
MGKIMGSTISEKILAKRSQKDSVKAGEVVVCDVDFAMVTDTRASNTIKMMSKLDKDALKFTQNTALVLDHYSPPPNLEAAEIHQKMRNFSEQANTHLYDIGDGICHQVLPEGGHLTSGDLIVGTDTHSVTYGAFNAFGTGIEGSDVATVMASGKLWFRVPESVQIHLSGELQPGVWAKDITLYLLGKYKAEGLNYKAIEYVGSAVSKMAIDDRMTLCNHAAELGAKAAILEADQKTIDWLSAHGAKTPAPVYADHDAIYAFKDQLNVSSLAPQVARKHQVDDVVGTDQIDRQAIQFALIGTCTNGRLDDIRQAAHILKGKKLAKGVRMIVTPASRQIYLAALREGLIEILTSAGASFEAAGCGTCVGITNHLVPGNQETVISSANRNFKGRLSNDEADIWLGSAATVAASALTGFITDPRTVAGGSWRNI